MDIARLMNSSFNEAMKALAMGTSPSSLIRARERAYVKALITNLEREFDSDDLRIFATAQRGNASDFGTNHLIHDITVCRIDAGATAERKPENFLFVAEALWQIEIDFSREWRGALYAINRLNCGAASNKLLIASLLERGSERFLNTLLAPAGAGSGTLFLALLAHPADWDADAGAPKVWQLAAGEWVAIS